MLVGTEVVSLALETIPDWNIAVFIPMVARVFTAMLKRSSCMLDVILLCLLPNILLVFVRRLDHLGLISLSICMSVCRSSVRLKFSGRAGVMVALTKNNNKWSPPTYKWLSICPH